MKAKLVLWSPLIRVVVPDNATEEEIAMAAWDSLAESVKDYSYFYQNVEDIIDDEEQPFNKTIDTL